MVSVIREKKIVVNSLSQNLLLRVYFFGGLILLVGLSILFLILNEAPQNSLNASQWVFSGMIASTIPIILSIGSVAGLTMYGNDSANKYLFPIINGVVLSMILTALVSIFIILIYGDQVGQSIVDTYVVDNMSMRVIVFPISIGTVFLWRRNARKYKESPTS